MHALRLYCPVCSLWGRICQRVRAGERIFLSWAGQVFTNALGNPAARFGREGARNLGAHSARGGAARAILESGGTPPQTSGAGRWHASEYRLRLVFGAQEAAAGRSVRRREVLREIVFPMILGVWGLIP